MPTLEDDTTAVFNNTVACTTAVLFNIGMGWFSAALYGGSVAEVSAAESRLPTERRSEVWLRALFHGSGVRRPRVRPAGRRHYRLPVVFVLGNHAVPIYRGNEAAWPRGEQWRQKQLQHATHITQYNSAEAWTTDAINFIHQTRNTFCGTWYLPHSQVHNERTVPTITAGCIRMHETAKFPLPLLNLTSPSCYSTRFPTKLRKFRRFAHI